MASSLRTRTVFTTGQVAKICGVAPRTVCGWFDDNRFPGSWRIPGGSRDRRIPRAVLLRFLRENGMPLGELEGLNNVMVVSQVETADPLIAALQEAGFEILRPAGVFEAGSMLADKHPVAAVIDCRIPGADNVVRRAKEHEANRGMIVIGLADRGMQRLEGCDDWFSLPADPVLIAARLSTLLNRSAEAA